METIARGIQEKVRSDMNIEDRIIVAYDEHIKSSPCLVVARKCNDEMHVINTFWNDKAKRLYRELTEGKDEKL